VLSGFTPNQDIRAVYVKERERERKRETGEPIGVPSEHPNTTDIYPHSVRFVLSWEVELQIHLVATQTAMETDDCETITDSRRANV
jgi:hypothetical protein